MKVFRQLILSLSLLLFPGILIAQKDVTTFGFVFKPIFPSKYFRTGPIDFSANNVDFRITQKSGISMGGVVRKGITKTLSIETGINYVKRNYDLVITDSVFTGKSDFKIVGYEIPLQALVFIQLSKDVWMNVALGPSIDLYPTDIETFSFYFKQVSNRTHNYRVLHTGLIANIGWEWRTKKSGYIYLGSCYHRSFSDTYISTVGYKRNPAKFYAQGSTGLSGDYLTFDLRYYFHEAPKKKKLRLKK